MNDLTFQYFVSRPCTECGRMLEPIWDFCGTPFYWTDEEKAGEPKMFTLMFVCPLGKHYRREWVLFDNGAEEYHFDSHGDVYFAKFDEEKKVWVVDEESWT